MPLNFKIVEPTKLESVKLTEQLVTRNIQAAANFMVVMVNMSNHFVIHRVAFTPSIPADYNSVQWTEIPPIPQTCNVDFHTCISQQKFVLMATVNCGYQGYCSVAYQDTRDGQWYGATFRSIVNADCNQYRGTALGLEG